MNTFVTIVELFEASYTKAKFYTVRVGGRERLEYKDFVIRILNRVECEPKSQELKDELNTILAAKRIMGEEIGVKKQFFRNERDGSELEAMPGYEDEMGEEWDVGQLRLYCYRVKNAVFLFNGDEKTPGVRWAKDCPVVKEYFREGNLLAAAIEKSFTDNILTIERDGMTIGGLDHKIQVVL